MKWNGELARFVSPADVTAVSVVLLSCSSAAGCAGCSRKSFLMSGSAAATPGAIWTQFGTSHAHRFYYSSGRCSASAVETHRRPGSVPLCSDRLAGPEQEDWLAGWGRYGGRFQNETRAHKLSLPEGRPARPAEDQRLVDEEQGGKTVGPRRSVFARKRKCLTLPKSQISRYLPSWCRLPNAEQKGPGLHRRWSDPKLARCGETFFLSLLLHSYWSYSAHWLRFNNFTIICIDRSWNVSSFLRCSDTRSCGTCESKCCWKSTACASRAVSARTACWLRRTTPSRFWSSSGWRLRPDCCGCSQNRPLGAAGTPHALIH